MELFKIRITPLGLDHGVYMGITLSDKTKEKAPEYSEAYFSKSAKNGLKQGQIRYKLPVSASFA
jgi:hypothetical protein